MGPAGSGARGNYWTSANSFPNATLISYYMLPNGGLDVKSPTNSQGQTTFIYDPNNPVPTIGGNNLILPLCGPQDETPLESRSDVITFTSGKLTQDLFITGRMSAVRDSPKKLIIFFF